MTAPTDRVSLIMSRPLTHVGARHDAACVPSWHVFDG
jgi:hypothetical protein